MSHVDPLAWMTPDAELVRRSDRLGAQPGPVRVLAACLRAADADEVTAVLQWLAAAVSRAEQRGDDDGARLARSLTTMIERGAATGPVPDRCDPLAGDLADARLVASEVAVRAVQRYVRTGDVHRAIAEMQAALDVAYASEVAAVEAAVLPFLAHAHAAAGDDARADLLLARSADARARLPEPESFAATVLTRVIEIGVRAAEGSRSRAAAVAAEALGSVPPGGWAAALIEASAADALGGVDEVAPIGAPTSDAPSGERLVGMGLSWAAPLAWRGRARSLLADGRDAEAAQVLRDAYRSGARGDGPVNAVEDARTTLVEAAVAAALDDRDTAVTLAARAADELARAGAVRHQVEALLALGAWAPVEVAADALGSAYQLSFADSAPATSEPTRFGAMWSTRPLLRVEVIGGKRITVGGVEVALGDKAEQLFLAVLTAGVVGAHWETVASWLWPDEVDMGKLKSRVSSTTNLARKALGVEAWRLDRDGPLLRVRRLGLTLDLDEELDEVRRTGASRRATEPLLPMWSDLEWVEDLAERRRAAIEAAR